MVPVLGGCGCGWVVGLCVCVRGGVSCSFLVVLAASSLSRSCCLRLCLSASVCLSVCGSIVFLLASDVLSSHRRVGILSNGHVRISACVCLHVLILLAASASVCVSVVLRLLSSCSGVLPPLSDVLGLPCRVFRSRGRGRDVTCSSCCTLFSVFMGLCIRGTCCPWDFVLCGSVIIGTRYHWHFIFSGLVILGTLYSRKLDLHSILDFAGLRIALYSVQA